MSDAREFYHKAVLDAAAETSAVSFAVVTDDRTYAYEILRGLPIDWDFVGGSEIEDFMTLVKGGTAIVRIAPSLIVLGLSVSFVATALLLYAMSHWRPGVLRKLRLQTRGMGLVDT